MPDDLPFDDPETEDVNETTVEIARVLHLLEADTDAEIAIRIGELMFRRLGRADFADTVNGGHRVGIRVGPRPVELIESEDGGEPREVSNPVLIPDISKPVPFDGLVALAQRAIELGRQGSASQPVPILDLVDCILPLRSWRRVIASPACGCVRCRCASMCTANCPATCSRFMGADPCGVGRRLPGQRLFEPQRAGGSQRLEHAYQRECK
ncbi:MAG: hypothetical protein R2838_04535 [Caldilineaceae bacterium]